MPFDQFRNTTEPEEFQISIQSLYERGPESRSGYPDVFYYII